MPEGNQVVVGKPTRRYRSRIFQAYLVGAIIAFIVLAVLTTTAPYFTVDLNITRAIQSIDAPLFDWVMDALTWLGFAPQAAFIAIGIILFLIVTGLRWEALVSAVSLIGSTALGSLLKALVDRPRPSADLVTVVTPLTDLSFPSGHVLFFTTFVGFLLFLVYTLLKRSWWRLLLMVVIGGMIALIGISRVYYGHHWASDAIGSYLVGSVWLSGTILVYRWGKTRYFLKPSATTETQTA